MEVVRRVIRQFSQCLHNFAAVVIGLLGVERRPDLIGKRGAVSLQPFGASCVMAGYFSIFIGLAAEIAASPGLELDDLTHGSPLSFHVCGAAKSAPLFSRNPYF
jgi:hypothetical protein